MTFVIGNKVDLISQKKTLKNIVEKYSLEGLPLVFTSAQTTENVAGALDLLAYSFLKEWEKKYTSAKFKGLAEEYLKTVKWTEKDLESLFVNLITIDSLTLEKKAAVKAVEVKPETKVVEEDKVDEMVILEQKLKILEGVKEKLKDSFAKNLEAVQGLILNLKKTPIDLLINTIDSASEQLSRMKTDFELNLESLLDLEAGKLKKQDIKKELKEEEAK